MDARYQQSDQGVAFGLLNCLCILKCLWPVSSWLLTPFCTAACACCCP